MLLSHNLITLPMWMIHVKSIYVQTRFFFKKCCHLGTIMVHVLFSAFASSRWGRSRGKWEPLSIMVSINADDWTSEQEHIGSTPPTCSAPDVTYGHAERARVPHLSPLFFFFFSFWFPGTGLTRRPWKYDSQHALLTHWGEGFFCQNSIKACKSVLNDDGTTGGCFSWYNHGAFKDSCLFSQLGGIFAAVLI